MSSSLCGINYAILTYSISLPQLLLILPTQYIKAQFTSDVQQNTVLKVGSHVVLGGIIIIPQYAINTTLHSLILSY